MWLRPVEVPLRNWLQTVLLALAVVVSLGTSKALFGKKLVSPHVQTATGVTVAGQPRAEIRENVNNQGCFASQELDFKLEVELRNGTAKALRTQADRVHGVLGFESGNKPFRVQQARWVVLDEQRRQVGDGTTLAAGGKGTLVVVASRVLSKKKLEAVRWLSLVVDLGGQIMILEFRGIDKLKTERLR